MSEIIVLKTIPVIEHRMQAYGKIVKSKIDALNIDKQVATEDTIKALKDLRAELTKEFSKIDTKRKEIKNDISKPYTDFNVIYELEIKKRYEDAILALKTKIGTFENEIKAKKLRKIKEYYAEICLAKKIDFAPFEKLNLQINLSTSLKKYKETCKDAVDKINDDLGLIKTQEHKAEILAEYKQDLNVSRAIKVIKDRKEREREETERLAKIEAKIEAENVVKEVEKEPVKNHFSAPTTPTKEPEMFVSTFEVHASIEKLKLLKEFLINNNINFKTI